MEADVENTNPPIIKSDSAILIDENEVAKICGRSVHTLRQDRHANRGIPYIRLGRSVRYLVQDIENYLIANRIDPEA